MTVLDHLHDPSVPRSGPDSICYALSDTRERPGLGSQTGADDALDRLDFMRRYRQRTVTATDDANGRLAP